MRSYKCLKCTNEYKRYILQGIHRPSLTNNVFDAFIASEVCFYVVNITLIENVTIIVIKQNCNGLEEKRHMIDVLKIEIVF